MIPPIVFVGIDDCSHRYLWVKYNKTKLGQWIASTQLLSKYVQSKLSNPNIRMLKFKKQKKHWFGKFKKR